MNFQNPISYIMQLSQKINISSIKKFFVLERPAALTWDGWDEWKIETIKKHPIKYFFYQYIRHKIKRILYQIKEGIWWVKYRTVPSHQYHKVKTGLRPGYYGKDTLILHANFNLLKEYVEIELSVMNLLNPEIKKYKTPKENGLENLKWQINLDNPLSPPSDRNPEQSKTAAIIKELYLWWVETRPNRKDVFIKKYNETGDKKCLAKSMNLDNRWRKEDTRMLIKLMKIRESLWT